nr:MAG TPA: hypothetical protein [Caudoviricetes sp.]
MHSYFTPSIVPFCTNVSKQCVLISGVRMSAIHFTGDGYPYLSYNIIPYLYSSSLLRDLIKYGFFHIPSSLDVYKPLTSSYELCPPSYFTKYVFTPFCIFDLSSILAFGLVLFRMFQTVPASNPLSLLTLASPIFYVMINLHSIFGPDPPKYLPVLSREYSI